MKRLTLTCVQHMSPVRLAVCHSWLLHYSSTTVVKEHFIAAPCGGFVTCCCGRAAGAYTAGCVCAQRTASSTLAMHGLVLLRILHGGWFLKMFAA